MYLPGSNTLRVYVSCNLLICSKNIKMRVGKEEVLLIKFDAVNRNSPSTGLHGS